MKNPYLQEIEEKFEWKEDDLLETEGFDEESNENLDKWDMRLKYSFAIPNEAAIKTLVKNSPLIEIGAGSGYWAYLIKKNGGDIIAFDDFTRGDQYSKEWFNVEYGTPETVKEYPDRNLFLCWPEYDDPMGRKAVENAKARNIIFIGESKTGCTGTKRLYSLLEQKYNLEKVINIPTWFNNNDKMFVYSHI